MAAMASVLNTVLAKASFLACTAMKVKLVELENTKRIASGDKLCKLYTCID